MNSLSRFYLPPAEWALAVPALREDEAKHCAQVLRKREGDLIEVFDGLGQRRQANLISVSRGLCELELHDSGADANTSEAAELHLAVAIPKGKTMDLIVQKAVELGVSSIQPLLTDHTVVKLDAKEANKKAQKWQKVALEACKQCGQDRLPSVADPVPMNQWLSDLDGPETVKIMASLAPGSKSIREVLAEVGDVCLLVGPEGDFSDQETRDAIESGFVPVTLGDIVLRVETAVFYASSIIRYEQNL